MSGRREAMGEEEPVREGDSDVSSTSLDGGHRKRKADDSDRAPLRSLPARVGRAGQPDDAASSSVSKHKRPRASSEEEGGAVMNGSRSSSGAASNGGRSALGRGGPRKQQRQRTGEEAKPAAERAPVTMVEKGKVKRAEKQEQQQKEEDGEADAMEVVEEEEQQEDDEGGKKGGESKQSRPARERRSSRRSGRQAEDEDEGKVVVVEGGGGDEDEDDEEEVEVISKGKKVGASSSSASAAAAAVVEDTTPKALGLIVDKANKSFKYGDKVTIKPPDVLVQHFEWASQKWFIVGAFNAQGSRIRGPALQQEKIRYRISYAPDEKRKPQVLYDEQGELGKGSSVYFRPPQFKIPGLYVLHFDLEGPRFKSVPAYEQTITVEAVSADAPPAVPDAGKAEKAEGAAVAKPEKEKGKGKEKEAAKEEEQEEGGGGEAAQAAAGGGARPTGSSRHGPKKAEPAESGASSSKGRRGRKIEIEEDEEQEEEQAEEAVDKDKGKAAAGGRKPGQGLTVKTEGGGGGKGRSSKQKQQEEEEEEEEAAEEEREETEEEGGAAASSGGAGSSSSSLPMTFEDVVQPGVGFSLKLPGVLQKQLVDEWFHVTRKRRLVPLPRKPSAVEIMRTYEREQAGWSPRRGGKAPTKETDRLCALFDGCLGTMLLYRFEREQYVQHVEKARAKKLRPHQVWGAEHLLRFLVTLPRLLTPVPSEEEGGGGGKGKRGGGGGRKKKVAAQGGKAKQAEPEQTEEEMAAELKQTGAFVQGLLQHLEAHHRSLFTTTEEAPEDYGLDVPRVHRQQH